MASSLELGRHDAGRSSAFDALPFDRAQTRALQTLLRLGKEAAGRHLRRKSHRKPGQSASPSCSQRFHIPDEIPEQALELSGRIDQGESHNWANAARPRNCRASRARAKQPPCPPSFRVMRCSNHNNVFGLPGPYGRARREAAIFTCVISHTQPGD